MAGVLVAQAALLCRERFPRQCTPALGVAGAAVVSVMAHLALDRLPHYNWIVYLGWFRGLPYHWLVREALFALPVLAIGLYTARNHWGLLAAAVFFGLYPDLEKVAAVDFQAPRQLVLFKTHSLQLSTYDGGASHAALIALELAVIAGLLAATLLLARLGHRLPQTEPQSPGSTPHDLPNV